MAKGKKATYLEKVEKLEKCAKERQRVFKALLEHLEEGLSLECFAEVHHQTVEKYIKLYPKEFVREEIEVAKLRGRQKWERIGSRQASGECLGNSRTWFYNMANRYGWKEKLDIEADHKGSVNVNVVSYASQRALQDDMNGVST